MSIMCTQRGREVLAAHSKGVKKTFTGVIAAALVFLQLMQYDI